MYDVEAVQIEQRLCHVENHSGSFRFTELDALRDGVEKVTTLQKKVR